MNLPAITLHPNHQFTHSPIQIHLPFESRLVALSEPGHVNSQQTPGTGSGFGQSGGTHPTLMQASFLPRTHRHVVQRSDPGW